MERNGDVGCRAPSSRVSPILLRIFTVICLGPALLAGCQTPGVPDSLQVDDARTTHTLREEPHRAAVCIARNIDRHRGGYLARIRQGVGPVLVEVDVGGKQPIALAQLLISGEGSTAMIWMTPDSIPARDELLAAMISGC